MTASVLQMIEDQVKLNGEKKAVVTAFGSITYDQLWKMSFSVARWLEEKTGHDRKPIIVYGHKSPLMIVCFMACARAGRAYCPVDSSLPQNRIEEIAAAVGNPYILATEELKADGYEILCRDQIAAAADGDFSGRDTAPEDEDVFYIIFTSGSTGKPKGVEVTAANLSSFLQWSSALVIEKAGPGLTFMNQAPFSFDLSVMDTYTSLVSGGTLVCLDKDMLSDMNRMFAFLQGQKIQCFVSTPSFAEMCMADPGFTGARLPEIKIFLFCGERLTVDTAAKLRNRFPAAVIMNTYGPTESTVAVTSQEITEEILNSGDLLPIGTPKKGTELHIIDEEIYISGDTVAKGYFKDMEKTKKAFVFLKDESPKPVRAYKTGDKGYFKNGSYYCTGRSDHQIKMRGYRIELGDIEENLTALPEIEQAAVIPRRDGEKIRSLTAFVVAPGLSGSPADMRMIKSMLKDRLPHYMIPRAVKFLDRLPVTVNGKLDRKKLEEQFL